MRRYFGMVMAAGCMLACRSGDSLPTLARFWQSGAWREIGPVITDTAVVHAPFSMAAGPTALYLFNGGDKTVLAVASDGHVLWRYTPADSVRFDNDSSVSVAADSSGRVYVADLSGGRITVLSPLGSVVRVLRIHNRPHLAVRGDGWFWGALVLGVSPALFDSTGLRYVSLSVPPTLGASIYARGDARLALVHDTLVVAYMWAGHFLVAVGTSPSVRDIQAIEPLAFAAFRPDSIMVGGQEVPVYRADSTDQPATLSMAVTGGLIYALYWNRSGPAEDRRRTLDIYDLRSGAYVGSRRLPQPTQEIAMRGDTVFALTSDGALHSWQWTSNSAKAAR